MRGEDFECEDERDYAVGSPPHARGRQEERDSFEKTVRITPACAGKTWTNSSQAQQPNGSPPHARGRHSYDATTDMRVRITPACAGKTFTVHSPTASPADHPRMRGEDCLPPPVLGKFAGSPPHARGRLFARVELHFSGRITPACAGKTCTQTGPWGYNTDHPRMRGEDVWPSDNGYIPVGSPPHARGRRPPTFLW